MQLRPATYLSALTFGLMAMFAANAISQSAPAPATAVQTAPEAPASNANPFPVPDPRNFTSATPSKEIVNDFLHATWGYDPNRIWQVQAILKTPAPGVSRVVVLVAEKGGPKEQTAQLSMFVLPDGKHIVADDVLPFGSKPFEENRDILRAKADGPSKGTASKDLEFVEFADFECPHCRDAQPVVAKLLADYPAAHYVYQDFPLVQIHSEAFKSSSYGVCVARAGGNEAFFKFADAVFQSQAGLTPAASDQTLKDAASKAGQDPVKVAACAATPATKAIVDAKLKLAGDLGVNQTPWLFVNGRGIPLAGVPYATLQKIINFQAKEDGLNIPEPPPPPPPSPAPSLNK